jgi:hypothetical protein
MKAQTLESRKQPRFPGEFCAGQPSRSGDPATGGRRWSGNSPIRVRSDGALDNGDAAANNDWNGEREKEMDFGSTLHTKNNNSLPTDGDNKRFGFDCSPQFNNPKGGIHTRKGFLPVEEINPEP